MGFLRALSAVRIAPAAWMHLHLEMDMGIESKLWRVLKIQFQIFAAFVIVAGSVSFATGAVLTSQQTTTTPFALPAIETHDTWNEEVSRFSERVTSAFGVRPATADEFSAWILEAAERQAFDPDLLAGKIATESSFRKVARSHVGAIGPAQVRPDYWSRFCGTSDLTDPEQNIYCGAQVLAYYRERCGGEVCALQAYNIGLYGTRQRAANRYVNKVDRNREAIASLAAL